MCAWVWPAAQSIPGGVRAAASFAPQSAGGWRWPDIADCLEIRTRFLLRTPKPCITVRTAADRKEAVADYKPNRDKFEPGIPDCRCNAPIGNCQVPCIFICLIKIFASLVEK